MTISETKYQIRKLYPLSYLYSPVQNVKLIIAYLVRLYAHIQSLKMR